MKDALKDVPGYEKSILHPTRAAVALWTTMADSVVKSVGERNAYMQRCAVGAAGAFASLWGSWLVGGSRKWREGDLTLDEARVGLSLFHVVTPRPPERRTTHLRYDCSCLHYQNRAKCKHVLYQGLCVAEFTVPPCELMTIIGVKAKRGRPEATVSRLRHQPTEPTDVERSSWMNFFLPQQQAAPTEKPAELLKNSKNP